MISISPILEPLPPKGDGLGVAALQEVEPFAIELAGLSVGTIASIDFVESLLTEGGASVVYGPSNCGKSFWILDLAVAVATGKDFRDELEVDQGAVVYVALEGEHGFRNRIEALKRAGMIEEATPLFLCFSPVSLLEPGHEKRLAESIRQAAASSELPCRLVIIDTMARAMAGGDENSGQDMTAAVASIDAVRATTGAHVAVVHHCGKDEARGARGHSSLRAAVDTEIEVSRSDGTSITTVRVTKQRDVAIAGPFPFSLEVIELGTDRRGKAVTSCIVHHEDAIMATVRTKGGRKATTSVDDLLGLLPQKTTTSWQQEAAKGKEKGGLNVSKTTFYDLLKVVRESAAAKQEKGLSWTIPEPMFPDQ
jgi:hypothetical protein